MRTLLILYVLIVPSFALGQYDPARRADGAMPASPARDGGNADRGGQRRTDWPKENVADLQGSTVDISEVDFSEVGDREFGIALVTDLIERLNGVAVREHGPNVRYRARGKLGVLLMRYTREEAQGNTGAASLVTELLRGVLRQRVGLDVNIRQDQQRHRYRGSVLFTIEPAITDRGGTSWPKYRVRTLRDDEPLARSYQFASVQVRSDGFRRFFGRDYLEARQSSEKTEQGMRQEAIAKAMERAVIEPMPMVGPASDASFPVLRIREGGSRLWLTVPSEYRNRLAIGQEVSIMESFEKDGRSYKGDMVGRAVVAEIVSEGVDELGITLRLNHSLPDSRYSIIIP